MLSLSHFILQPASSTKVSRLLSIDPRLVSHRERVHGTAYNADMGTNPGAILDQATAVDAWLLLGAVVVASSDRAARALQAQFHRRRRAKGLLAWPAPQCIDWTTFVRTEWEERNTDGRLLLNPAQELAVWSEIVHSEQHLPTALPASVRRLAVMAIEAHDLVCTYAPQLLREQARAGWDQDAGAFSRWLADFDRRCRKDGLVSSSRLALELISMLHADPSSRNPLRLAGFDRIPPVQRELFDAWGEWRTFEFQPIQAETHFHSVRDVHTELESCAYWCHRQVAANPGAQLLVITQEQAQRRGEIERAFLRFTSPAEKPAFEFSLGVPLTELPFARSALLLLRWLQGTLSETELDWLFASGFAGSAEECAALQSAMRTLRRRDLQRPQWHVEKFLNQTPIASLLPREWTRRIIGAQRSLREAPHAQSPTEWADAVPHLLERIGWLGSIPQTSVDFQAQRRWNQALDIAGSLGFDGRSVSWGDFLFDLGHAAQDILFAPQSVDAPIQITGPAESAGLDADGIWFLGSDEESWPAVASTHPFLPSYVQREFEMPHSSHIKDWDFSATITARLLASAPLVQFSFALQRDDVESRPSRLITGVVGAPQPVSAELLPPQHQEPATIAIEDFSKKPYRGEQLQGGAAVLSYQSQCPFKAFATARLGARGWDAAENGLSAKQRGELLHDVLHSIWSGRPRGIKNDRDLLAIKDLARFVGDHVKHAMESGVPAQVRDQMPPMYLQLEQSRLVRLVTSWLEFEKTRVPFAVEATEAQSSITIAGLRMHLRLDRVDRLHDGSQLVIDYKTGTVDPKAWDLPRPDDVQLPLYKLFGLAPLQQSLFDNFGGPVSGGLVFARVRTGETCFAGRVADARATINPDLNGNSSLVKRRLTAAEESDWKEHIEKLAEDFIHGRAEVNPRDYPTTCARCGLQPVCRIQEPENRARFEQQYLEQNNGSDE